MSDQEPTFLIAFDIPVEGAGFAKTFAALWKLLFLESEDLDLSECLAFVGGVTSLFVNTKWTDKELNRMDRRVRQFYDDLKLLVDNFDQLTA